jgi:hypothetical protein
MTRAMMQVLENMGVVFGEHVKGIVTSEEKENFQIYDTKSGRFIDADKFRTDVPLKNYQGYVLN